MQLKAGAKRDGYFDNDDLVAQVEISMDIIEEKTHRFKRALFLFDNATSHQKWAPDAPTARKIVLNPKFGWTTWKDGPKVRDTVLPDGTVQSFYFENDHPTVKGMKVILDERGLWQSGLLAQCKDFKCAEGPTDCCAHRILFNQPDFVNVKSHLQEVITA